MNRKSPPPAPAVVNRLAGIPPVPGEFDDVVAWVTWLYYADQLTQNEIADIVHISRATVVKLLREARERGAVHIRINTEALGRTKLSRALRDTFGLTSASVIPSIEGAPLADRLGDAGARVLSDRVRTGDTVGVAWGRTVLAVAAAMPRPETPGPFTVVQVSGSSPGSTVEFSPELCSSLLASRMSARCANLLAPAVVSNPKLRDMLLAEPTMIDQFRLIRSANWILFGIGDLGPRSTVRASGHASPDVIDAYVEKGAIGVILGRFVDASGREIPGELDGRTIGISLDELLTMPGRLCVAGGPEKIEPIKAALRAGYIERLVTDADTATALLSRP